MERHLPKQTPSGTPSPVRTKHNETPATPQTPTITRKQRKQLKAEAEEFKQQVIQAIITTRENEPQESRKQLQDAHERGIIWALITARNWTPEEWTTQPKNCTTDTEH